MVKTKAKKLKNKKLMALSLACLLLEKARRRKKRRCWTRQWIMRRPLLGFCETLIEELVAEDSAEFRTMFRMEKVSFDNLLHMIGPSIERAETTMRQTISAKARLLVTLRFPRQVWNRICCCKLAYTVYSVGEKSKTLFINPVHHVNCKTLDIYVILMSLT